MVTEDAFHGNLGILIDISPKMHGYVPNYKCKDFVHITPLPMSYNRSKLLEEPPSDLKGKPGFEFRAILEKHGTRELREISKLVHDIICNFRMQGMH